MIVGDDFNDLRPARRLSRSERAELAEGRDQPLPERFELKEKKRASDDALGQRFEITLEDRPVPVPETVVDLMSSIIVDMGEIPDDYLSAAGPGEYDLRQYDETKLEKEKHDHALFVAYAPTDAPKIAVAVIATVALGVFPQAVLNLVNESAVFVR